jgi:nickel-dependent lactate racemase
MYYEKGAVDCDISSAELKKIVFETLEGLGEKKKVLIIPPDFTRFHSRAGEISCYIHEFYGNKVTDILPALGTHSAMTDEQLDEMFPGIPKKLFRVHDWRNDVITVGEVPAEYVSEVSEGAVDYAWPAQINKLLVEGEYDLILSVGQVVPHEVVGMANYTKNIFVGTGGVEGINKSHFIGAAYGMERIMGRAQTSVRKVINYGLNFIDLPIVYFQTVIGADADGKLKMRGIYISDEEDCFLKASDLALKVNFKMLDKPLKKVVVYLDPSEFKSTWLGNKSIYRTRMAIDDDGELIVLAPGLKEFGEDSEIDRLIRKYGYVGTPQVMKVLEENQELADNLSAAAHLIHGSSEGRFSITYCPGHLTKEEIESVNFKYADLDEMMKIYDINKLKDGFNTLENGEEIFYISNPALGLWAFRDRF